MKPRKPILVFGSLVLVFATSAFAQTTYTWDTTASGNTGSWGTATNWTTDVIPAANDTANFTTANSPATITLDGNQQIKVLSFNNANTIWNLNEGTLSGAKLNITDGDATSNEGLGVSATVTNTTLNLNVGLGGGFSGSASSDEAVFTGTNSTVNLNKAFTQRLTLGTTNTVGSVAMIYNLDATNVVSGRLSVGFRDNVSQAPSNNVASTFLRVNQNQTSSIDQIRVAGGSGAQAGVMTIRNDATWTQNGGFIALGYATSNGANGKSTGRLEIGEVGSAGNLTLNNTALLSIGNSAGTGILNVNNGTLTIQANIDTAVVTLGDAPGTFVAANGAGHGTLNLNTGGTLVTQRQFARNATAHAAAVGSGTFNFDGGLLQINRATGNVTTDLFGDGVVVNIQNGGARIDTLGNSTVINRALNGVGNGGLEKLGAGTLTLGGANTFTGTTKITGGTLTIGAAGSIANSSTIIVGASTTLDVSAVTGGFSLSTSQTLAGPGTVTGAMAVNGTLSPGNSPGNLTTGSQTWFNGGDFNLQILDAAGAAGTGFDSIAINGTLDLTNLSSLGFAINLWSLSATGPDVSGNALNFSNSLAKSWTILTTSGGITGFDAGDFVIKTSANNGTTGFSNSLAGGSFALVQSGNNLQLTFAPVPEPRAALLGSLGMIALLRRRR